MIEKYPSAQRWRQIKGLVFAMESLPESRRQAFLQESCAGDIELYRYVGELVNGEDQGSFLEKPVIRIPPGPAPSPAKIGPYRILDELGRGGMGVVYLAEQEGPFSRKVAIKVLQRGLDTDDLMARFHRERQILAQLTHPNIARLYDGGTYAEGKPYIAMEWVEGMSLLDWCRKNQPSLPDRLRLFQKICGAVQYAHRNLVVHRDLKPGNILVTASGEPKLLDFGIAKLMSDDRGDVTTFANRCMTTPYASPEQIGGSPTTTATDIYSLGVVLYEMLTGWKPFVGSSGQQEAVIRAILAGEVAKPSALVAARGYCQGFVGTGTRGKLGRPLRGDLDAIVGKAMRLCPDDRYSSAEQMARDIGCYLNGYAVSAHVESRAYFLAKFVSRNRWPLGLMAFFLVLLGGFAVAIRSQQQRALAGENQARIERIHAENQRKSAEHERERAEQMGNFLGNLFGTVDPYFGMGRNLSARQLLDLATERIAVDLKGSPVIQASLLEVIADVNESLGKREEAEDLIREAYCLRLDTEDRLGLAGVMQRMAFIQGGNDPETVLTWLRRACLTADEGGRDRPIQAMGISLVLANVLVAHGGSANWLEAEGLYGEIAEVCAREGKLIELGEVLRRRGLLAWERGRFLNALDDFEQSLPLTSLRGEKPGICPLLRRLAMAYQEFGRYAEAEKLYLRILPIAESAHDRHRSPFRKPYCRLGTLYRDMGRYAEATPILEEVATVEGVPPLGLIEFGRLADLRGERDIALACYHRALASPEPMEVPMQARLFRYLGIHHRETGQSSLAADYLEEARALLLARYGVDHPRTAQVLIDQAELAREEGAFTTAESHYRAALAVYRATYGEDHLQTATVYHGLGLLYASRGQNERAHTFLASSIEIRRKFLDACHPLLGDSFFAQAQLYLSEGAMAQAREMAALAEDAWQTSLTAGHPGLAEAARLARGGPPERASAVPLRR